MKEVVVGAVVMLLVVGCASTATPSGLYAKPYRLIITTELDEADNPLNDLDCVPLDAEYIRFYTIWNISKTEHHVMWRLYDDSNHLVHKSFCTHTPESTRFTVIHRYKPLPAVDRPGTWKFEMFMDGQKKLTKKFTVVAPQSQT